MIFSAKDKELFKEIFNKEFPLTVRDLFQIIILICIVVIFSELLANKIGKLLINDGGTILGSKNRVPFAFFVILLISTIAFYICLARNDFIPSKKMLFFTFLIGIVAYQTTFLNQHFFFACFVYVVIFFLCQLQLLISHLDWQYQIKKATQIEEDNEKRTKTTQGFLSDEPIPVEKEKQLKPDNKGYSLYAQKIAKKIKESHFEKSFAIGINGQWGSGKTSMSNLIRRHTQDEEDVISIDFKPWSSSTPDAIIKDFFETLQDELSPYHAALSRLLIRYSRKLTSIDSNVITQTIEYAANYILDLDATNKVYEKINNALKDINKKIIIYIDDLDRLEQSEIMEVIRLIRNTANFYNTFFIVAYDKAFVNNALDKADIHNHEKFLEKIFQLEVHLPYYNKFKLKEELAEKLKTLFPEKINENTEREIKKKNHQRNPNILYDWLENSRDVTRLCNSLMLNYPIVKDYVIFKEFLLIEVLRINYPDIYKYLSDKGDEVLELSKHQRYRLKELKQDSNKVNSNQDNGSTKFYLDSYLGKLVKLNPKERDRIFSLISNLFGKSQNYNLNSIIREDRFFIYFNYANFDGLLSYNEFNRAYKKDEKQFFKQIKDWVQLDLGWLVAEYLATTFFEKKEDFEKCLRASFLIQDIHPTTKIIDKFLYNIKNKALIDRFYNNYEKMMESIFQPFNKNDIRRKLSFINYFRDEDIEIFKNILLLLFDVLIKSSNKFNYEMTICTRIVNRIPEIKDEIINRIRKFIIKNDHLSGFLISTLCPNDHPKDHIIQSYIKILFPDLDEFEELLLLRKEESEYVEEYLDFYNKCKQSNFEDHFDFPFSHFPTIEEWKKGL